MIGYPKMTINNIDVTQTIKNARAILAKSKKLSQEMRAMVELLILIIELLVAKFGKNSGNSHIPPSQDPHRKRGAKNKKIGSKKPGGQKGRVGTTLKPIANPDKIVEIAVDKSKVPEGSYAPAGFEKRQAVEVNLVVEVIEYRAEVLKDAKGKIIMADFPPGVTRPIQYGSSVKALAVYLSQFQLLPYDRISGFFKDKFHLNLSQGSVFNFNQEAYEALESFENLTKEKLLASPVLNADETGININGKNHWLHTVSSEQWTLFFPHTNRGQVAMDEHGILNQYTGILCHDHWKPYFQYTCLHALCNAHHLRELERAWEQDQQKWALKMKKLLLKIKKIVDNAGGSLDKKTQNKLRKAYRRVLKFADQECPPPTDRGKDKKRGRVAKSKARNLLERLINYETEVLRFMENPLVPFTNNQSENDIRMTKVQQKISGCFRSIEGAKIFCRIRSYLITCQKHQMTPTEALALAFSGKLPEFMTEKNKP